MKNGLSLAVLLFLSFNVFSFTPSDSTVKTHRLGINKRFGMISGGPYIQVGLGFPTGKLTALGEPFFEATSKLGKQYSIEFGYQHLFYKSKSRKLGIGLNISLFNYNNSNYIPPETPFDNYEVKSYGFCGIGPMTSIALNKRFAVDVYFNLMPSLQKLTWTSVDKTQIVPITTVVTASGLGGLIVPGVRVRYSIFTLGFEYQYAKTKLPVTIDGTTNIPLIGPVTGTFNGDASVELFLPRFTLGIKL